MNLHKVDMDIICSGCLIYERHTSYPDVHRICIGYLREDTECPCQHCLIKMMCKNICDKLRDRAWCYKHGEDPSEP